ncbi:helix-turn-helix domain-containing protein [Nocardioides sp. BP30]|uniref:helix-turn-helix domain-containing protein n=1 Tax=Nocardioides sp. BP30 TaxID=3036374 RepID=UPI0024685190|nr:helix-turn-helix domain-containing protein [Nocardioides sp. BP30]WGL52304.1 helix-turn-helix domain-containing protein [Nocardioides sp. BP30]
MDADLAAAVGTRVRAARRRAGWSVGGLASRAGVGKGSLSEIENGTRNPTLSTLYALAGALDVPLATLLVEPGVQVASPGIVARLLDARRHEDGATVEVYLLHLEPGVVHRSGAHGPGVTEYLLLTHGRARVGVLGQERDLAVGETAVWVSDAEHAYEALGGMAADAVLTIRSPG